MQAKILFWNDIQYKFVICRNRNRKLEIRSLSN